MSEEELEIIHNALYYYMERVDGELKKKVAELGLKLYRAQQFSKSNKERPRGFFKQ